MTTSLKEEFKQETLKAMNNMTSVIEGKDCVVYLDEDGFDIATIYKKNNGLVFSFAPSGKRFLFTEEGLRYA